ncbi:MAG: hypothetical protein GX601_07495 [Anaerolineales bacterium]|nr:hypothetical protein [Anaerolineales bacterium]
MLRRQTVCAVGICAAILSLLAMGVAGCKSREPSPATPETALFASPLESPAATPAAGPGASGSAGRILFHSNHRAQYDIYVLDLATGENSLLTDAAEHDLEPAISPDGSRIAFARSRLDMSGQDIWVMNVDGSDPHIIASMEHAIATCPDWSPDGQQLAFYAAKDGHFRLFLVSADSGDLTELAWGGRNDMMPDWSPDGTQILFASDRDGQSDLYIMSPDGSNLQKLTDSLENEWRPRWSPDGKHIVFQGNQGTYGDNWNLYLLEVATGEIEQLTEGDVDTSMPAWSDDGSTIFFVQERVQISGEAISGNRNRLYALDLEQRVISELGEVDASDSGYPTWVP